MYQYEYHVILFLSLLYMSSLNQVNLVTVCSTEVRSFYKYNVAVIDAKLSTGAYNFIVKRGVHLVS